MHAFPTMTANRIAYSVDEAAQAIGVSRRTLYDYIAQGALKSLKIGGRRLIRRDDLVSLIDNAMEVREP